VPSRSGFLTRGSHARGNDTVNEREKNEKKEIWQAAQRFRKSELARFSRDGQLAEPAGGSPGIT
jgi:hypothetical protein